MTPRSPPSARPPGAITFDLHPEHVASHIYCSMPLLRTPPDLEHEAELLESGEKHLLSLNLWATRKRTSGQVLLVSFPAVAAEGCGGGEASKPRTRQRVSAESALKHAADAATSYAIAVDDANSSMLQAHVAWNNRTAEEVGQPPSAVVPYECSNCSHTEFGTIFRIMTRMHVSPDELHANRDLIDFYFPAGHVPSFICIYSTKLEARINDFTSVQSRDPQMAN